MFLKNSRRLTSLMTTRRTRRQHELRVALARQSLKPRFESLEIRALLAAVTWDGGAGTFNWNDANNWDTNVLPTASDHAVIPDLTGTPSILIQGGFSANVRSVTSQEKIDVSGSGGLFVSQPSVLNLGLDISAGHPVVGGGQITIGGASNWAGNTFPEPEISDSGIVIVSGTLAINTSPGSFANEGVLTAASGGLITIGGSSELRTTGSSYLTTQVGGTIDFVGSAGISQQDVTILNAGTLQRTSGSSIVTIEAALDNTGKVDVSSGGFNFNWDVFQNTSSTLTAGTWAVSSGASLSIPFGTDITTIGSAATVILDGTTSSFSRVLTTNNIQGTLRLTNRNFVGFASSGVTNNGTVLVDGGSYGQSVVTTYTQSAGTTTLLNGASFGATVTLNGGTFAGSGTVTAPSFNNVSGTVSPGNSPGILNIPGNYVQGAAGVLNIEVGGTNAATPDFDQLIVGGTATLAGTLSVSLINGFLPDASESFRFLTFASSSGSFSSYVLPQLDNWLLLEPSVGPTFNDLVGTSFITRNTADVGSRSLRDSIGRANASPGSNVILFSIPGAGPHVISPLTPLPILTEQVTINATSQSGYSISPLIELNGTSAGAAANGLKLGIGSNDSIIKGLSINRFSGEGIWVDSSNNILSDNFLGTDTTGNVDRGNGGSGIALLSGSNGNLIKSSLISGNSFHGILVQGNANKVQGNRIGTNRAGTGDLGNSLSGVYVYPGSNNFIGVDGDGIGDSTEGNLISGNDTVGIFFQDNSDNNVVAGNLIGTDVTGTLAIGNTSGGISFFNDFLGDNNRIGTDTDGVSDVLERNIISGNLNYGIVDYGAGTKIAGNYVGTKIDGLTALPNIQGGVSLGGSGAIVGGTNAAARNVISGNAGFGVAISSAAGNNNTVQGNYIGVDKNGNQALPNTTHGVFVQIGANNNTIGGTTSSARNIISGNAGSGVEISGIGTISNRVLGNYIGLGVDGATDLGNSNGVSISDAPGNFIGGGLPGAGNVISGNAVDVAILGSGATGNRIQGNRISMTANGLSLIAPSFGFGVYVANGATDTFIGTDSNSANDTTEGNLIGFASTAAIFLQDNGAAPNRTMIAGNRLGLNALGAKLSIGGRGIWVQGATNTRIGSDSNGTSDDEERNIIVPFANSATGILVTGGSAVPTTGTTIAGNYIGLDAAGQNGLSNSTNLGIALVAAVGTGISNTLIGGTQSSAKNVIGSGSLGIQLSGALVSNNQIEGNFVGTDKDGTSAIPNGEGIRIEAGASNNTVGGTTPGAKNVISGNTSDGINIGVGTPGTVIQGNYIGVGSDGTTVLGNAGNGILTGSAVQIGGLTSTPGTGAGNVISGNGKNALNNFGNVYNGGATGVVIQGNIIGLDKTGTNVIRQGTQYGIWSFLADNTTIGGPTTTARNIISGHGNGILLQGGTGHIVQNNHVGTDISGNLDKGNSVIGISTDSSNTVFRSNLISGNDGVGLTISGSSLKPTDVQIVGNVIGLNAQGTATLSNDGQGLVINVADQITVGGTTASDRNIISGNVGTGVSIVGGTATTRVTVQGNYLGLGTDGLTALGNIGAGVTVAGAVGTMIGGTGAGAGNVISGNSQYGILIDNVTATGTLVQGNFIGTDKTGTQAKPNPIGVQISGGANNNNIGGTTASARNLISGNTEAGIKIDGASNNTIANNQIGTSSAGNAIPNAIGIRVLSTSPSNQFNDNEVRNSTTDNFRIEAAGNTLRRNASSGMGSLPIRLNPATLTPGAIVITQVVGGNSPLVLGEVQAQPNQSYTIDLFSSPVPGQADRFIVSSTVNSDANGFATFSLVPPAGQLNGYVTATLTGLGINGSVSTSQLSNSLLATPVVILGLRGQSPEGTPITLSAFASSNPVTGYLWEVRKDGLPYTYELRNDGTQSEGGIQFTPDNQGVHTVSLRVTLSDGSQFQVGPFATNVYNVAPTPSFDYSPTTPVIGTAITLTSNNSDPGQQDILKTSWVVRSSSPTGTVVSSTALSTATTTIFTPTAGGLYYVTMTVDDGDGGVRTLTRSIDVSGLPTAATFVLEQATATEGQRVRVYASEPLLNRTEKVTFNWTLTKTPIGGIASVYPFTIASQGAIEFVPNDDGDYQVGLTVSDSTGTVVAPTQTVTVGNASPSVTINGGSQVLALGVPVTLNAVVSDPGTVDTQTVVWKLYRNRVLQPLPTETGTGLSFTFTPAQSGIYEVSAEATDDDFIRTAPIGRGASERAFTVNDSQVVVAIVPPPGTTTAFLFNEGAAYTFTSSVPSNVSTYAWKARTVGGVVVPASPVASSGSSFTFTPPQGGLYQIELQVTLTDGRQVNAIFGPMNVVGIAPTISSIVVSPAGAIKEGTAVTVHATATDGRDPIGLTYVWEIQKPGSTTFTTLTAIDGSPTDLQFTPTDNGIYNVRISVYDSQGLFSQQSRAITIENANPSARLDASTDSTGQVSFTAIATDPGADDVSTLQYTWTVNGVVNTVNHTNQLSSTLASSQTVSVTVTDKDGGSDAQAFYAVKVNSSPFVVDSNLNIVAGTANAILVVGTNGDDSVIVQNGLKKVYVFGGDGADTIDARLAQAEVYLDGGTGNDMLYGGSSKNTLVAGTGTNFLYGGSGANKFVGGGDDSMFGGSGPNIFGVHFSDVKLVAGGVDNTIDLTAAQAGVTLNVSNNTGVAQQVFTGATLSAILAGSVSQPVNPNSTLSLTGTFQHLVGSPYDDQLTTATQDTTIAGGDGNDTLFSTAPNTMLDGGAGDDTIVLTNASGTFTGGGGNDTIRGQLLANSATQISTGDGNDVVDIVGPSTASPASINLSVGGGINTVKAANVSGNIYGGNGSTSASTQAFGSTAAVSNIAVTNSNSVGIFGSPTANSSVVVGNSTNVSIFGAGILTLENVTLGNITSTLFGNTTGPQTVASITNSTNVGIFGSTTPNGGTLSVTATNSTNMSIFGSTAPGGTVAATGGGNIGIYGVNAGLVSLTNVRQGLNTIETGQFGDVTQVANLFIVNSTNVSIFGSTSGPSLAGTVTNSSNISIFGTTTSAGTVRFINSTDLGIFGLSSGDIRLEGVTRARVSGTEFGNSTTSTSTLSVTITNSLDVGIFGATSNNGPALAATVTNSTNVGIFGSVTTASNVTVTNSIYVGIFGSTSVGSLVAGVTNSSDVKIFGSTAGSSTITAIGGSNVSIYGLGSGSATLTSVMGALVRLSDFGSTTTTASVTFISSQDVRIFGSSSPNGVGLSASISSSTNVGIFGSATGNNTINVTGGSNVGIYGGYDDIVNLMSTSKVYVEGGVFGMATSTQGTTITVGGNSTNVSIFGTPIRDTVTVGPSSLVWVNLGAGDDQLIVDGGTLFVAIGDAGIDRATIRSGGDILIYLGDGNDQSEVFGGSLVRLIGEAGDDQFIVSGGENVQLDMGDGNDQAILTGGAGITVRADRDNDVVDIYGGIGINVSGGTGTDTLRVFGSLGAGLDPGLVYALLDGQDDNDTIEIRPLLSVADRGPTPTAIAAPFLSIPAWMTIPTWISSPSTTTYASSIALIGGAGADSLWLEGASRLYGLGGDGVDTITLQAGNNSEISGGYGADVITVNASGMDNRVFGDQDNDTLRANDGVRLGVFGEQGADTIAFFGGTDSFARGGVETDTVDINNGTRITIVGEDGNDVLTVRGGSEGVAAGGTGNDTMEITGGSRGILLGQSGDDTLRSSGGTQSILSGGDGDDNLTASNRGDDLYGDDGNDSYQLLAASAATLGSGLTVRLRELLYVDPKNFEPESRGSDSVDLSAFATSATLNLGVNGVYNSATFGLQSVIVGQLQLILLGALENIVGTDANDVLTGSSESNRLIGRGGNDRLIGLGGDDTLDGGTGNDFLDGGTGDDIYLFGTTQGAPLGNDTVYEATSAGVDSFDFNGMPVGLGTLDLNLATSQPLAGGLLNLAIQQSATSTARGDVEEVVGTSFDETVLGNELDNRIDPGQGNDTVDGRAGSDIYVFSGRNLGNDIVSDASAGNGRDTLDFTAFDAPLNVDIALTTPQNLGEMTLTLGASDSIENVIGTSYNDVILGNTRDNALFGAAGTDRLDGRAGNDKLTADLPSVVLLDFDSAYRADRGDYNYSTAERTQILLNLQADYAAFDWIFTTSETQAQTLTADMGRSFVRVAFSQGRGGGVSGDAGQVDFRNVSRRLVTEVNINGLLPTVRALTGDPNSSTYAADFSAKVVALTTTIAGHELAHTAGLRHADSLGPIGTGVYAGTNLSSVYPPYTGAIGALETGKHIIASPASVGTTIADAIGPTYFGEREAIKLAFDDIGTSQRESSTVAGSHGSIATAENLGSLAPIYVPNLAPATGAARSGQSFKVSALDVVGDLTTFTSGTTEKDFYRFTGKSGEYVNVELLVNGIRPLRGTAFDGELRIFKADGTQLAFNDDDIEGTLDPSLMDILLPADGDYIVSVGMSASPAVASTGGRYELFMSRFIVGPSGSAQGDTLIGGPGNDTLIGGAADDLFLADGALPTDLDSIDGRGGYNTLDKKGLVYNYTGIVQNVISSANTPPTVAILGPPDSVAGQSASFTFTATDPDTADANGPFQFAIDWGDGTTSVATSAAGQRFVSVSHFFNNVSSNGVFTIKASAKDVRQLAGPNASLDFGVTGFNVMADPIHPGQKILVVVGTQGADTIRITEVGHDGLKVRIRDRESSLKIRGRIDGDVNRILVFALDGNDQIIIDDDVDVDAQIWGGRGNDYIEGGEGNDIIWGGAGDDVIFGGDGRDILIGGTGADRLVGDAQDDILIGGLTAFDEEFNKQAPNAFSTAQRLTLGAQRLALEAILAEWASHRTYAIRRNNILGVGTGTRLNGNNFFKVSDATLLGNTVFDDGAQDKMWGSCGIDWFFANTDGDNNSAIDRIMDGESNETRTDIDKWW
jgi:Ca2+-binding RTX toxin-like protein